MRCFMKELFEYLRPQNFQELDRLIEKYYGEDVGFLAGGTDLIVKLKRTGVVSFKKLIDIKQLGLNYIKCEEDILRIGSATSLSTIEKNHFVIENYPILIETIDQMASVQVRNRATIGGNLCNAAPSADLAPPLIVLDADLIIRTKGQKKKIDIEDFFQGPGVTKLSEGDLLVEIQIPTVKSKKWSAVYLKEKRTSEDIALAGVGIKLSLNDSDKCDYIKIALGAVGPIPLRAKAAEKIVLGNCIDELTIEKAAEMAAKESKPIEDVRATIDFRRYIIKLYTKRAIQLAYEKIKSK